MAVGVVILFFPMHSAIGFFQFRFVITNSTGNGGKGGDGGHGGDGGDGGRGYQGDVTISPHISNFACWSPPHVTCYLREEWWTWRKRRFVGEDEILFFFIAMMICFISYCTPSLQMTSLM